MTEQVMIISLHYQGGPEDSEESIAELNRLTDTAGGVVVDEILFKRQRPDAAHFIGPGQVRTLKSRLEEVAVDLVVVDHELKPSQQRNLEEALECKVIDRTQLILDIFAKRAITHEGKLQVELAQLSYLLPRLSGKGASMSRLGAGIGTRGPGETKLEQDRRRIRDRIAVLKRQIETVKRTRRLHREDRQAVSLPLMSLIGYTNAGKSALLRMLTGHKTLVEDKLFATLDLATRKLILPPHQEVLLTDTVGFIRRLPHHLVAAFRSTLEEAGAADLLLIIIDCSDKAWERQKQTVEQVLKDLNADKKPHLLLFNKIDKISTGKRKVLKHRFPESIQISALSGEGKEALFEGAKLKLAEDWRKITLRLPYDQARLRNRLLRRGRLLKESYGEKMITLTIEIPQMFIGQIDRWKKELKQGKK